jgi:hypothetical protein
MLLFVIAFSCIGIPAGWARLIISQYVEGSGFNKVIQIRNSGPSSVVWITSNWTPSCCSLLLLLPAASSYGSISPVVAESISIHSCTEAVLSALPSAKQQRCF